MRNVTTIPSTLGQAWNQRQPALAKAGWVCLCLMLPTLVAHALDTRTLMGVGVWVKPLKFQLSLAVYLLTLAWLFPLAGPAYAQGRGGRFVVWGPIAAAAFELAYIGTMAARGEPSHFNLTTPLRAVMYQLMGAGATVLTLAAAVLAFGIARQRPHALPPALHLAVVLGLATSFVFGTVGGFVIGSGSSSLVGGLPQAGDVPGLGWSRQFGDLRVSHFLALHAMQLVPAWAWLLCRWLPFNRTAAVAGTAVFSAAYIAAIVATLAQALAGQPLLPHGATAGYAAPCHERPCAA